MHVMMGGEEGQAETAVKQRKSQEEDQSSVVDDFGGQTPEPGEDEELQVDHDHARCKSQKSQIPIGENGPGLAI